MSRKEWIVFGAFVAAVALLVLLISRAGGNVVSIKIDLPPAEAPKPAPRTPIYIDIADDGSLTVDGAPSSLDTLTRDVAARSHGAAKDDQRIMIRAGQAVKYETFIAVMNRLQGVGWTKVGLVQGDTSK